LINVWLRSDGDGVILSLHIQPGAKKTAVVGPHGDALKIRLAAPPVEGKANAALIDFITNRLGVGRAKIELISGKQSRRKRVRIYCNLAEEVVAQALLSTGTIPD
jgi:uncharacterized protein